METPVEKVIDLKDLKPVKSEGVDLEQFDKKETELERVSIIQVKSDYSPTKKQWVLKVESKVLTEIGEDENKIQFRASELFNLTQDKEGILIGFPDNEGSNLYKFLKDIKAKTPTDIVGKSALIKSYDKNGKTYLKFRY